MTSSDTNRIFVTQLRELVLHFTCIENELVRSSIVDMTKEIASIDIDKDVKKR